MLHKYGSAGKVAKRMGALCAMTWVAYHHLEKPPCVAGISQDGGRAKQVTDKRPRAPAEPQVPDHTTNHRNNLARINSCRLERVLSYTSGE
eukprot:3430331-Amphidinium_carterae.1